jgi:glycosyltransferase involved in cell wall biosynthesis
MSCRLRIAEVAPLYAAVPPVYYGGTERVVHGLTETLVKQGHDVTLFAAAGARTSAKLHSAREKPLYETWKREPWRAELAHASLVAEALQDADAFDVVHFQLGSFSIPFSAIARTPTVHSLSSPLFPDDAWNVMRFPRARLTARSHRQVEDLPARRRRKIDIVYNGCDFDFFPAPRGPGRKLVFLGRMAHIKNPAGAIRLALRADIPIVLAGEPVEKGDRQYFESEVRPLLDNRMVTWVGPVDDAGKRELFADAAALLFPIQTEEAFGIVMIEAMACGVPVVACEYGSVPEVVDFGVTGYYSEEEDDLAELIPRALQLDRGNVRRQARLRFSRETMTDAYLRVFESAIAEFRRTAR